MAMKWLRFCWDLKTLPEKGGKLPLPVTLRLAKAQEIKDVQKVVMSSFCMDTGWADVHKSLVQRLNDHIEAVFAEKDPMVLALQYGQRIIGVSVLAASEDPAANNLISGPCILHEYRCRGLGSSLLEASLLTLRDAGQTWAYGAAREKTIAGRFLYPKFGSKTAEWISELDIPPKLAA